MTTTVFAGLPKHTQDWLYDTQKELEIEAVDKGIARYHELLQRNKGNTAAEMQFMRQWMPYLIRGITKEQERLEDRIAMVSPESHEAILLHMDADKLAFITLTSLLRITQQPNECPLLNAALYVTSNVKTQVYLDLMNKRNRDAVRILANKRKKLDKNTVMFIKRKLKVENIRWKRVVALNLGMALISLAVECLNIFETTKHAQYKYGPASGKGCGYRYKATRHLVLKQAARDLLEKYHSDMEAVNPYGLPMVVPPVPWTDFRTADGGYLFLKNNVVKGTFNKMIHEASPQLLKALNTIQSTEWRINKRVAMVMEQLWLAGGDRAGIPGRDLRKIPAKPEGFNAKAKRKHRWKNVSAEDRDKWMAEAQATHDWNHKTIGSRYQMLFKLDIAKRFCKYPVLYFPHQVDWRGRCYPIPAFVGPQADDTGRALLEFAQGEPLGKHGFYWLCIHVANLWGLDKEPVEVRLRVVLERCAIDLPRRITRDPLANQEWTDEEDPFKLLAALYELQDCLDQFGVPMGRTKKSLEGFAKSYLSRVPVAVDGSCNGLQHYSAIGLDPIGGRATNLVPSDRPQDIYTLVADVVNQRIEKDIEAGGPIGELALRWRSKVTRKVVKRAVMTTPYGVTKQGILMQFIADGHCRDIEGLPYQNANYLKNAVYDAVSEVVVSARLYMDWLQEVTGILASTGKPTSWTTPIGCRIVQDYRTAKRKQIRTPMGYLDFRDDNADDPINENKQASSIAPNVVHSFDACHLYMTVLQLMDNNIRSIGAVHDSYAVHAGNVNTLQYTIRDTFFKMHKDSLLESMKRTIEAENPGIELPELPPRGGLDLHGVYGSQYFFH